MKLTNLAWRPWSGLTFLSSRTTAAPKFCTVNSRVVPSSSRKCFRSYTKVNMKRAARFRQKRLQGHASDTSCFIHGDDALDYKETVLLMVRSSVSGSTKLDIY